MNKIKRLLAVTGGALMIAGCQYMNNEAYVAANNLAIEKQSVTDTVPKKDTTGRDTVPNRRDTMMGSDTASYSYIDLRTGQPVDLYYSPKNNRTYSMVTNEPVDYYVNLATGDTVYGRGRYIVNNYLVRSADGMYNLDDKRIKMDKNDIKMKDGTMKLKMDKGKMKMKDADGKWKMDKDNSKMKTGDMKMKTDSSKMKNREY
jgi:hypothetical protein